MKVAINLDKAQVAEMYRQMALIRLFEEQCARQYQQGKIRGFLHLYIGQEAVAVGAMSVTRKDDYVITSYRDHGHAIAKGIHPNAVMAELFGKVTGCSGGKGGSMHLFDIEKRFMGGHAIVAGQMPLACGLGLAIKRKKEDSAVLCFFGDGAVNEGYFHESLNLASLWKLPVIFFLENNMYGMGTLVSRARAAGKDIYLAADAYNIPAAQIDGMDVAAVREATAEALKRVRTGDGPVFIEAMTYRFRGHSMSDASYYRESSEVEREQVRDPIPAFKKLAVTEGLISEKELAQIDKEVEAAVTESIKFANESPNPPMEALFEHIIAS
ncbi:MAG: pyruvate dehydrogenase (acetyl-transferring) E1 component subunit alpha [SAR202 cluster bacterium]|nr:pyruvate dehydrogenase (acetyl-transferring) E1 component subunit alpha [SAR202 cluster bacterium]